MGYMQPPPPPAEPQGKDKGTDDGESDDATEDADNEKKTTAKKGMKTVDLMIDKKKRLQQAPVTPTKKPKVKHEVIDVDDNSWAFLGAQAKAVPRKRISVYSVGEEPMKENQADNQNNYEAIQETYQIPPINALVKVKGIRRKNCASLYHPGEHWKNLEAVAKDTRFLETIDELCYDIDHDLFNWPERDPFVVCFMCKEGRHRSVAAAKLWTELLRRRNFIVEGPDHLCFWNWWGCKGLNCDDCRHDAPFRTAMFDNIV